MTVGALLDELNKLVELGTINLSDDVQSEGCDCIGDVASVKRQRDGSVLLVRPMDEDDVPTPPPPSRLPLVKKGIVSK